MDVNHAPAEAGTATLEDLATALAAVQWDFAETEDEAAIESYKAARAIEGQLVLRYGGTNPHEANTAMLKKVAEIWAKHAPANYQI
jgi:hypothetical protein